MGLTFPEMSVMAWKPSAAPTVIGGASHQPSLIPSASTSRCARDSSLPKARKSPGRRHVLIRHSLPGKTTENLSTPVRSWKQPQAGNRRLVMLIENDIWRDDIHGGHLCLFVDSEDETVIAFALVDFEENHVQPFVKFDLVPLASLRAATVADGPAVELANQASVDP